MALVMTPIYTQTVGAGGSFALAFNNIPQFYTDLMLKISVRDGNTAISTSCFLRFNGNSSSIYSQRRIISTGSGVNNDSRTNSDVCAFEVNAANATSNTFGNAEIYIPNYTSSNSKSFIIDTVTENNATAANTNMIAGLFSSSTAISQINFIAGIQFLQNSTFSLYGIIRSGA